MRRKVEELRERLARFIEQRDDLVLVARCSDPDGAAVNKLVEGLDEASSSRLFWVVVDEFKDAASFAEACVQGFASKHNAARLVAEKEKLAPLPALPESLASPTQLAPVARVRTLIQFSRSLLPSLEGSGVVWAFLPMQIRDGAAYATFMTSLWQHELPFPWCHHARLIVRDSFPQSLFGPTLARTPRLQSVEADFSPEALRKAMEEEAGNDDAPLADRINNTLMLAGVDYSHCRYDRAVAQYSLVHRFAAATKNTTLAAIALNGLGEVRRAQGQGDEAGKFFEAALAPAAQAPGPPVPILFNLFLNLGELRHGQQRWEEAEVFLHGAADFAFLLHDPAQRLRCWMLLGEARHRQGKVEPALKTWSDGAIVAGRLKRDEDHHGFLKPIREHYLRARDENGLRTALKKIEDAIAAAAEPTPTATTANTGVAR